MIRFGKQSGTAIQQYSKRTPTKRITSTLFVSFQYEINLHRDFSIKKVFSVEFYFCLKRIFCGFLIVLLKEF